MGSKGFSSKVKVIFRDLGLVVVLSSVFPGSNIRAQQEDTTIRIDEVRIVSSKLQLPADQIGQPVTVIRKEDIERTGLTSIDELLKYLGFAEVQSRGAPGVQSDISLRGSTFNQVLVLIDGMRVNDPLTGHFNAYLPVSPAEIEEIEVFRGPAAALYGPDAVGGVINVITNTFHETGAGEKAGGEISTEIGENRLYGTNSGFHADNGKIGLAAGARIKRSDGHLLPGRGRADFNLQTYSVSVAPHLNKKLSLAFRTGYDRRLFNARNFYTRSPIDSAREQVSALWNQAMVRYRINDRQASEFKAVYRTGKDSFLFHPDFPANVHRSNLLSMQWNHYWTAAPGLKLTGGLQADHLQVHSSDRGDHQYWHTGLFLMAHSVIAKDLFLNACIRTDHEPRFGWKVLPQLGASYRMGRARIRTALGRTSRIPDFTELYVSTNLPGPLSGGRNLGNPGLRDEDSWNFELGMDHSPVGFFTYSVTMFSRRSDDLIDYLLTPAEEIPSAGNVQSGQTYFYARNIGLVHTKGIETEGGFSYETDNAIRIRVRVAYTLLDTKSKDAVVSKYISAHSGQLLKGGFSVGWSGYHFYAGCLWKQRDPEKAEVINASLEESYALWNVKLDKNFLNDRIIATFQVDNLFNETYEDILGAVMPGRWIHGSLVLRFGHQH